MGNWRRWFQNPNPLLRKELRGRMRGARAFVVLTIYLLLLSCFAALAYSSAVNASSYTDSGVDMSDAGKALFYTVVLIEIVLVTFITPAFTAGTIAGERERKTYELLKTTLLPVHRLVGGKLTAALTYILLLLLAAVPLESLAFMLGGVTAGELGLALVLLLVTALFFGVLGLFFSSITRTTLTSTVLTYGASLMIAIGIPTMMGFLSTLVLDPLLGYTSLATTPPFWVRVLVIYLLYIIINLTPLGAAVATEIVLYNENSLWYFMMDIDPTSHSPVPAPSGWIIYTLAYLVLSALLLAVTMLIVRRQERK